MKALVEIKFNSNTRSIPITMIEGIQFSEDNFTKPNVSSSNWTLKAKINISSDNILTVSSMATGRSLHKADVLITVKYKKSNKNIEKKVKIEDDTFSKKAGIILFSKEIQL